MDVQGYLTPHRPEDSQSQHYAHTNLTPTVAKSQALPSLQSLSLHGASKQYGNDSIGNDGEQDRGRQQQQARVAAAPATTYASSLCKPRQAMAMFRSSAMNKRKSSPAILGVPLGLNDEVQAQLSLHLSRQRNSIEAAMLLANLKRLPSSTHATAAARATERHESNVSVDDSDVHHDHHDKSWTDDDSSMTSRRVGPPRQRRHSYDATVSWSTMPASFLERSSFYHDAASSSVPSSSSASPMMAMDSRPLAVHPYHHQPQQRPAAAAAAGQRAAKMTWFHDDSSEPRHGQYYAKADKLPPMLHHHQHTGSGEHPLAHSQHGSTGYHGMYMGGLPPPLPQQVPGEGGRLHLLAQSNVTTGQKREHMDSEMVPSPPGQNNNGYYYPYPLPPYSASTAHPDQQQQQQPGFPAMHAHHGLQNQQMPYVVHRAKLPLLSPMDSTMRPGSPLEGPPGNSAIPAGGTPLSRTSSSNSTKRRRNRAYADEDDMANAVEPGDPDFPDMALKDIEAARVDPEARPRRQKLRYLGDKYTPQWVRYNGQAKEGLCDTCQPGKWLQLKNSAFWYHKQFYHGISSVSGKEFMQPLETRWVDHDLVEGLCHQCHQWVSVSNVKRKNSVLWFRHAHKCHVYHKPKPIVLKRQ